MSGMREMVNHCCSARNREIPLQQLDFASRIPYRPNQKSARLSLWTPNPLASTRAPLGSAAMPREQSKKRTEEQTKQKAELQNLRMQINRLRRKGGDTEDLLQVLGEKEKIYGRGKQQRPWGA